MARSSSVAKSADNSTEIRPFQSLAERLFQLAENDDSWQGEIMRDTVDRIASADSPEAIFDANDSGPGGLKDAEELLNKPLAVDFDTFRYIKSAEQYRANNLGVFLVFDAYDDNGEKTTISTGAPNVVASLARLQMIHKDGDLASPYRLMFKSKQTSRGYNLLLVTRAV